MEANLISKFQNFCGLRKIDCTQTNISNIKIENYAIFYFFKFCSYAGIEICTLLPVIYWTSFKYASIVCLNLLMLLFGQFIKDILKLSRPDSSKVIILEDDYETEYGFPSMHTISAMLPFSLLLAFQRHENFRVSIVWWLIAIGFVISVGLSRLYFGVHSFLDIFGGFIVGTLSLILFHVIGDELLQAFTDSYLGLTYILFICSLFILLYPRAIPWSSSYGTSALVIGSWMGCMTAINYLEHFDHLNLKFIINQYPWFHQNTIYRFIIGSIFVFFIKTTSKIIIQFIIFKLNHQFTAKRKKIIVYDKFKNIIPENKLYEVEVPVKLINYFLSAWATIVGSPFIWKVINI